MTDAPLLELRGVTRRYGGLVAVNELSMRVWRNTVHGLIGPNGAGKSTAFDLISGLQRVSGGQILLEGRDITNQPVEARVRAGICRTFQTPRLFEKMTALEVVMTGRHVHGRTGMLASMFSIGGKLRDERDIMETALALLDRVGLSGEAHYRVANLSYGKRRLVEIARALATEPSLLLLDEVASGLNPVETAAVADLIRGLASENLTIVLVEHDMPFVMGLCEDITVLNFGSKIAHGPPAAISSSPQVLEAYLGRPNESGVSRRDRRRALASTGA